MTTENPRVKLRRGSRLKPRQGSRVPKRRSFSGKKGKPFVDESPAPQGRVKNPKVKKYREFFWSLPKEYAAKGEMTPEQLEAEAREERPLLKKVGVRDSALFHVGLMKTQYLRAATFLGWLGIKPYIVCVVMVLIATSFMSMFFWLAMSNAYTVGPESTAPTVPIWIGWIIGFGLGLIITVPSAALLLAISRFDTAYAQTTVVQAEYDDEAQTKGRRVVALARVPLLRMATVTKQDDRYIGPEGRDSFGKGRSLVEVTYPISRVTDVRVFYDARPRQSNWSGMFASSTNSWYSLSLNAGGLKRKREMSRKEKKGIKLDPVGNGGVLICLISLGFAALMSFSGFDAVDWVQEQAPYNDSSIQKVGQR